MRWVGLALAFGLAVFSFSAGAQQQQPDFSKVEIKTTDLGHRTYMLEGLGGNMTVAVGDDGVILVDTEFAPLHDKIKAAIAKLSSAPIRYAIDTHFHGDHTGGNAALAAEGTIVVAQENVKKRLAEGTENYRTGGKNPPVSGGALPGKTYATSLTLAVKGRKAVLRHASHAHTDGDTYVWFADANVLSTGDCFVIGRYPGIDFPNGGNIKGMVAAADAFLKLANDGTKIVPGHGPLADRQTLVAYRTMLVAARDRVAKLVKAGKTEDETIAAKPLADYDAKLGMTDQQRDDFVRVVYRSLKG